MVDYGIDNAGDGFDSTDDELDSMFAAAMAHEEKDDNDATADAMLFGDGPMSSSTAPVAPPVPAPIVSHDDDPFEDVRPPVPTPIVTPEPDPVVETAQVPQPIAAEPIVEEVQPVREVVEPVQPASAVTEKSSEAPTTPTPVQSAPVVKKSFHGPSSANEIARVIRVVDSLRKLSNDEREVVSQFLTGGEVLSDESQLVEKALTVDSSLLTSMTNLKSAKKMETVDRVFFVIDLSHDDMHHLGALVSVFAESPVDENLRPNNYAREIVKIVDVLTNAEMKYIDACERVLSAVEGA